MPDKNSERETPETVTQSAIVALLTALCREVASNFEFTGEQHMFRVNTGRQGGGFVAKDDGGLDRLHGRKAGRDRWVVLECKPRFSGDDPRKDPNTALGQHAAELLGVTSARIKSAQESGTLDSTYSSIDKTYVNIMCIQFPSAH